jgi:hypothetical protein
MIGANELRKVQETLEYFADLVRSQVNKRELEFERLLDGYFETRRTLAQQFSLLSQEFLLKGDTVLASTLSRIEARMRELFGVRIPGRYLVVRGYKGIHPILLEYLSQHISEPVRSSKLRVLTGDQTHTERRVRDLRDLGFAVEWKKTSGEDQYELRHTEPDLDKAARLHVRRNIVKDKSLDQRQKDELLAIVDALHS